MSERSAWSTWRITERGSFRFFSARLGERGQGFELLTITETNWLGGFTSGPGVYAPVVEVFGDRVGGAAPAPLTVAALRLYLSGEWSCGTERWSACDLPAPTAFGRDVSGPVPFTRSWADRDPREWTLACDVDPATPIQVRLSLWWIG